MAKHQAQRTIAAFEETAKKAQEFLEVKAKAEKGDGAAKYDYLLAQLELSQLKLEEAKKRAAELNELRADQKSRLDSLLLNLEVKETFSGKEAGKKFVEMKNAGRIPTSDQEFSMFWHAILNHAEKEKDVVLFEEALTTLKTKFGNDKRKKKFLDEKEAVLQKLKEGK